MSSPLSVESAGLNRVAARVLPFVPNPSARPLASGNSTEARRLFELEQLEVSWEAPTGTLWTFMRPRGRPSYNPDLLDDFHSWQRGISAMFAERPGELRYLVLGSRTPGIFNLGGDLHLFVTKIRNQDRLLGCLRQVVCAD